MKKIRLTEEELTRIVKRTLIEMEDGSQDFNEVIKCINDYFKFKAYFLIHQSKLLTILMLFIQKFVYKI